jgi:hypothetical protein
VESAARFVLLLAAFGLILSWIKHGPQGPTMWMRAKFLGRTT